LARVAGGYAVSFAINGHYHGSQSKPTSSLIHALNDYAPANPALRADAVSALEARLRQAEETEILARKALEAARDARIAAGWELHNTMLDVKAAVIGQYGANSDAVQSLGLKRKSDYRRPTRHRNGTPS
jgi:hypothetical protein